MPNEALLTISVLLSAVAVACAVIVLLTVSRQGSGGLKAVQASLDRLESALRDEIARSGNSLTEGVAVQLKAFGDLIASRMSESGAAQREQLDAFSKQLGNLMSANSENLHRMSLTVENSLSSMREQINKDAYSSREELSRSLKLFEERFSAKMAEMTASNEKKLEDMRATVEGKLKDIQADNSEKIEKIRATVEEKLHKTLEDRLGQSFKLVSERLELVHKGLGEMQSLAAGVGDLKKVLSNVKTRGILGELQLGSILEQMLSPEQFVRDIATKEGCREIVEFAIKLPGKEDGGSSVYLPVDSKFPLDVYNALLDAYDSGDQQLVEEAGRQLEGTIKRCAKDIRDKYIDPPNTTDFAVMFLPVEGLFAEVVRRPGLMETLSRDYRVNVTGPTTFAALLNSLQMGFRTLAIERRSSEVWKILGAVKTEFMRFGEVLESAQKRISQANEEIDALVGTRTRQIMRKLSKVSELPQEQAAAILPPPDEEIEDS